MEDRVYARRKRREDVDPQPAAAAVEKDVPIAQRPETAVLPIRQATSRLAIFGRVELEAENCIDIRLSRHSTAVSLGRCRTAGQQRQGRCKG